MNKGIFLAIFLLFLLLCYGLSLYGDRGYSSAISMKEVVILHKEEIRVGDIISAGGTLTGINETFMAEPLPLSPDRIHIIPSRVIREMLKPEQASMAVIIGSRTAVVPYGVMSDLSPGFAEEFCLFLLNELRDREGRVEVEILTNPLLTESTAGRGYSFCFLQSNRFNGRVTGDAVVEYSYQSGEGETKRGNVYISIHLFLPALRAARLLRQEEPLRRDALVVVEEEVSPFTGEFLPASVNPGQYVTRTVIKKGDLILMRNLSKRIDVRAGDQVTIVVRKGSVRLLMRGKAYNSGSIGDEVRVRPADSDRWLTATVTGEKEVGCGI
jgi:flagella basal body P-ring formation protein FlgA